MNIYIYIFIYSFIYLFVCLFIHNVSISYIYTIYVYNIYIYVGHDGTMWEAERLMFQTNPIQTKQIGHHLEVSQNRATPSSSRHGWPSLSIETTVTTGDPPAIRKLIKPQWRLRSSISSIDAPLSDRPGLWRCARRSNQCNCAASQPLQGYQRC